MWLPPFHGVSDYETAASDLAIVERGNGLARPAHHFHEAKTV
jgi:hypothetical protein